MPGFDDLCSWESLLLAWHAASCGKRGQQVVAAFEYRLEEHLLALQEDLRSRSYQPGGYHSFFVHEPKRRLISAAPFRDRVVHHALCQVIEPAFERSFIADSYANRVGKGTHRALDRLQHFTRRFRYALPCDLRQFFPSIDHEILMTTLAHKIADPDVLRLCRLILDSGRGVLSGQYSMVWFPGDDLLAALRPRGLPIGNLTSQFWANCHLTQFDHFVKRELRCPGYVRYVDDFVLFADDKRALWEWKAALVERLARLRLTIHPGSHPRLVTEGLPFLGFTVYPHRRRLKRRKGVHFARKLRALLAQSKAGEIPVSAVTARVRSWVSHAAHGNTVGLRKAVLSGLRLRPAAAKASPLMQPSPGTINPPGAPPPDPFAVRRADQPGTQ